MGLAAARQAWPAELFEPQRWDQENYEEKYKSKSCDTESPSNSVYRGVVFGVQGDGYGKEIA
jgi:hypothetical protein